MWTASLHTHTQSVLTKNNFENLLHTDTHTHTHTHKHTKYKTLTYDNNKIELHVQTHTHTHMALKNNNNNSTSGNEEALQRECGSLGDWRRHVSVCVFV